MNRSSVTNLQDMPDDVLVKIVDFIAASDGNYLYKDRGFAEDDVKDSYPYIFEDRSRNGEESATDRVNRIIDLSNVRYSVIGLT